MRSALLLNASYEPLSIVSWKKAITLTWLGKAEIITNQDKFVTTYTTPYPLPSVLRLLKRVRVHRTRVHFSRLNVYRRDGFRCQYCGIRFSAHELTFDHVMPKSRGGIISWTNIVSSCQPCNRKKCSRTPAEAKMPLLTQPVEPRWWPFSTGSGQVDHHPDDWKTYLWT